MATGATGKTGATGSTGATGQMGETGQMGPTGQMGETGQMGPTGQMGSTGQMGETGQMGATGQMGETGQMGPTGQMGATGQMGETGSAGSLDAWSRNGNLGTVAGTNFLGTLDAQPLLIVTNGNTGAGTRFTVKGQIEQLDIAECVYIGEGAGENAGFDYFGNTGGKNVYIGYQAGTLTGGVDNVGIGWNALHNATAFGDRNVAIGSNSSSYNYNASDNTAVGYNTLAINWEGFNLTAIGSMALGKNTTGQANTAIGAFSLYDNIDGTCNTAVGVGSLPYNISGNHNSCLGQYSLGQNTTGTYNIAVGSNTSVSNTSGSNNTVVGSNSIYYNVGSNNCILGAHVLYNLLTGSDNIVLGASGGQSYTGSETNNILINNSGVVGDNNTIRIGDTGNVANYQAGIYGVTIGPALNVVIDSNGQLATVSSTRDKKENIIAVDEVSNSAIVNALLPRRFDMIGHHGEYQSYGLIVDEVENVCPDLVAKKSDGTPVTVYYQHIPIMLLAEVKRLNGVVASMEARLAALENV
jgi:hypothetical protein